MIYILGALGLTSLVLGAIRVPDGQARKRERRALPEPKRKEAGEE